MCKKNDVLDRFLDVNSKINRDNFVAIEGKRPFSSKNKAEKEELQKICDVAFERVLKDFFSNDEVPEDITYKMNPRLRSTLGRVARRTKRIEVSSRAILHAKLTGINEGLDNVIAHEIAHVITGLGDGEEGFELFLANRNIVSSSATPPEKVYRRKIKNAPVIGYLLSCDGCGKVFFFNSDVTKTKICTCDSPTSNLTLEYTFFGVCDYDIGGAFWE